MKKLYRVVVKLNLTNNSTDLIQYFVYIVFAHKTSYVNLMYNSEIFFIVSLLIYEETVILNGAI